MRRKPTSSRVRVWAAVRSRWTAGARMPGSSRNSRAKRWALLASRVRSSSARVVAANSSNSRSRSTRRRTGRQIHSQRTASRTAARSVSTRVSMPGRRTLTTTRSPLARRARWAWAREAAPTGSGSTSSNRASTGRPKSSSIRRAISGKGTGGTRSWRPASSRVISTGSTSTRVLRNWPSLISTPPSSTARSRKSRAWSAQRTRGSGRRRRSTGIRPRTRSYQRAWRNRRAR